MFHEPCVLRRQKMKKVLISLICLAVAATAFWGIRKYRDNQFGISITLQQSEFPVGKSVEIPVTALATGVYEEKAVTLVPEIGGSVDWNKVGQYTLTVTARYKKKVKTENFTVTVTDKEAPVLTLKTKEGYFTLPGGTYEEEGYTAVDNYDGDITDRVELTRDGDTIRYSVTDASGNTSTAERTIVYSDPLAPVITLNGESEMTIMRRKPYLEEGATAVDNYDGDVTEQIVISGGVDTSVVGEHMVTYTVKDSSGNKATAVRYIHVIESDRPIGDEEEAKGKVIYLTFDDGPSPYTRQLLDVLDKYNVKATFFVVYNKNFVDMIGEEFRRGHSVGVHAYNHDYSVVYKSEAAYWEDFEKMQAVIKEQTGQRTNLLRFPGGSSNTVSRKYEKGLMTKLAKQMGEKGYFYFDWNVLSGDAEAKPISTDEVFKNVTKGIEGLKGRPAVVLQHDIKKFSLDAVERIIQWGLENGYTFLPLDETSFGAHHGINN